MSNKITREVAITENVEFLDIDLENSVELWADAIKKTENYNRLSQKESFIKNGYDILMSSKELETLYLN